MKAFLTILLFLFIGQVHAQAIFLKLCRNVDQNTEDPRYSLYRTQFSWLKLRFQTSNCSKIATEIKKLSSFNQILPSFEFNRRNLQEPSAFTPVYFKNFTFHHLVQEEEWNLYRDAFKYLELFFEFKNLTHINHDPISVEEEKNICDVLNDIPQIRYVTIRYFDDVFRFWGLKDREIECLINKKINIYILGDFSPNQVSQKFMGNISGIENFLGDIRTLQKYKNLEHLGLLQFKGETSLKVLTGIKGLKNLQINLENVQTPEDIGYLKYLEYLSMNCLRTNSDFQSDCSSRALSDISFLSTLTLLKGLDISRNMVKDISPIANLKRLEILNLSTNRLDTTVSLNGLKRLKYLDISSNKLRSFDSIKVLKSIRFLNISGNHLTDYSSLLNLPKLKYLSAGRNSYAFKNLNLPNNLKVLNLSGGGFIKTSFTANIRHFLTPSFEDDDEYGWTNLTLFDSITNGGYVNTFPNESLANLKTSNLSKLEFLSIANNNLSSAPSFNSFPLLKYLDISSNRLGNSNFLDTINPSIEFILLNENSLRKISELKNFSHLKFLDLSGNSLNHEEIDIRSNQLTDLVLENCNLTAPPDLSFSPNIERLSLAYNSLNNFASPSSLKLQELLLWGNNLQEIPNLKENESLHFIALRSNKINSFKNLDNILKHNKRLSSDSIQLKVRIDIGQNLIDDLSIFKNFEYKNFELVLDRNLIDKTQIGSCPTDSANESVSAFCSSI